MTELLVRYVKIAIGFAIFSAALIFWTSCSYKEIKGKEMAPGLVPGKNYWILIKERSPEKLATEDIVAFEYIVSPGEVWQARENDKGDLDAKKLELVIRHKRIAKAALVSSDLRNALSQAGLHDSLAEDLDEALAARADLHDVHAGTRLRVIATQEDIEARFARYSEVLAVDWIAPGKAPLRVYGFHADKTVRFYDAKGRAKSGWL